MSLLQVQGMLVVYLNLAVWVRVILLICIEPQNLDAPADEKGLQIDRIERVPTNGVTSWHVNAPPITPDPPQYSMDLRRTRNLAISIADRPAFIL
jgi:hypothetical protein